MARGFDTAKFNRQLRAAQRNAEAQLKREIDRVNKENKRRVDAYNREVDRVNRENRPAHPGVSRRAILDRT